jgi:hypothetical protein
MLPTSSLAALTTPRPSIPTVPQGLSSPVPRGSSAALATLTAAEGTTPGTGSGGEAGDGTGTGIGSGIGAGTGTGEGGTYTAGGNDLPRGERIITREEVAAKGRPVSAAAEDYPKPLADSRFPDSYKWEWDWHEQFDAQKKDLSAPRNTIQHQEIWDSLF